jgi:VWFA-related protein
MTTRMRYARGILILALAVTGAAILAQEPQDQQRPVFRTGTSLVRVDAYPSKDGKIIEGLAAEDFEVFEDGELQRIDSFQFIRYEGGTPLGERRDPNSQRDAFNLAADPNYRIFVIYLDNLHVDFTGSHAVRQPLINFMNRVLGPRDLFGVLTTAQSVDDLMLGQKTDFIEEQLTKYWDWGRGGRVLEDDEDLMIEACFAGRAPRIVAELIGRRRLNEVFSDLEGVMAKLAEIREERKNIVLVSDGWPTPPRADWVRSMTQPTIPRVGVTDAGKLTMGRTRQGEIDPRSCEEFLRLADIDFRDRFREFLQLARASNVTFYMIKPAGLTVQSDNARTDTLLTLADQTDGIAIVNTNDLRGGAERIGDDLSASYILGYYPTNTKADGRIRKITVRLKGSNDPVRARREYRAPTEEEMASMRAATAPEAAPVGPSPAEGAFTELKRLRPAAPLHSRGTIIADELVLVTEITAPEIEAGRWKDGGEVQVMLSATAGDVMTMAKGRIDPGTRAAVIRIPIQKASGPFNAAIRLRGTDGDAQDEVGIARTTGLLGRPLLYRLQTPTTPRPAASVLFRRTERIQVRWPLSAPAESKGVRILGRDGVPLELQVNVKDLQDAGVTYVVADLNLAPLTQGEYVLEATATAGGASESSLLAIRVGR